MRSLRHSIFKIGMFTNKYINMALAFSVLVLVMIIEVPFFTMLFMFTPVSLVELLVLAALSSFVLWVGEMYKQSKKRKGEVQH